MFKKIFRKYAEFEKINVAIKCLIPNPITQTDLMKLAYIAMCVGYKVEDYDKMTFKGRKKFEQL